MIIIRHTILEHTTQSKNATLSASLVDNVYAPLPSQSFSLLPNVTTILAYSNHFPYL